MTHTVVTHQDEKLVAADECHAPFRAAFLDWLQEASDRLMLPVSVWATSPRCTELKVPGLHPALEIALAGGTDINVYVSWKNVCWDILTSMDVYARCVFIDTADHRMWDFVSRYRIAYTDAPGRRWEVEANDHNLSIFDLAEDPQNVWKVVGPAREAADLPATIQDQNIDGHAGDDRT